VQKSRIAQRVPLERFSKFDCIFYPQNVPLEQKALNLMTLPAGASRSLNCTTLQYGIFLTPLYSNKNTAREGGIHVRSMLCVT